jgi:iron-sulfur cluster assembly protein
MALELTELAAKRIDEIKEEQELQDGYGVRLGVESGGCSGLSYVLELDEPAEADRVFESHGIPVFCDPKSYLFINGTIVDYVDDLLNGGFRFENPNVSRSCGCGTSFAV